MVPGNVAFAMAQLTFGVDASRMLSSWVLALLAARSG